MSLRASIDLGTNTCLLLVAEWDAARSQVSRIVLDHSTVVRLGQGVDQAKVLAPDAIERTLSCLEDYVLKAQAAGMSPESVTCVATSQARDAKNGADFFSRVERETGFKFRTISGEEEAHLTFVGGLLPGMKPEKSAVIDIGGGSTELMAHTGGISLEMGSVRYTERFLKSDPVQDEEFWACQEAIDQQLAGLENWRSTLVVETQLIAVAGTATTLAAWHLELARFDSAQIDQVTLTRGDLHRMVEELKWRNIAERKDITGIEEGRADVLLAGAMILWRAHEVLRFPSCRVSTRGLRYGVLGSLHHSSGPKLSNQ